MSKTTVAITAYKRESVFDSIDSVMSLTKADAIVNFDCMNSKLYKQVKGLEHKWGKRLKVIQSKSRGLSGSRNILIKAINSEYILFLDDDDVVTKEFGIWLEKIDLSRNVYRFGKIVISDSSSRYSKIPKKITSNNIYHSLQISSYLLKKDIYKKIRFAEGVLSEDVFMAKDIYLLEKKQVSINIPSIKYKAFGEESITSNITSSDYEKSIIWALKEEKYMSAGFVALWIGFSYTKVLSLRDVKRMRRKYIPFKFSFKDLPMVYKFREIVCL